MIGGLLLAGPAMAGGCSPVTGGGAALPPCCATTDMSAGGQCMAPARQYQITLTGFGFEKADGTDVRLGGPKAFDAASVSAGRAIGDYLSGVELPPATYVALRPRLGETVAVRVNSKTLDGRRCQGSMSGVTRQANGQNWPACAAGQPDAGTPVCRDNGQLRIRNSDSGAFTVGGPSTMTLTIQFDVNNGVICTFPPGTGGNSAIAPGVLALTVTKS